MIFKKKKPKPDKYLALYLKLLNSRLKKCPTLAKLAKKIHLSLDTLELQGNLSLFFAAPPAIFFG